MLMLSEDWILWHYSTLHTDLQPALSSQVSHATHEFKYNDVKIFHMKCFSDFRALVYIEKNIILIL